MIILNRNHKLVSNYLNMLFLINLDSKVTSVEETTYLSIQHSYNRLIGLKHLPIYAFPTWDVLAILQ